jgi:serine O-acetyltransferase
MLEGFFYFTATTSYMDYPGYILQQKLPSPKEVQLFTEDLIHYLFPVTDNAATFLAEHEIIQQELRNRLHKLINPINEKKECNCATVVYDFFDELADIKEWLLQDAHLILDFDPAATSLEEVILSYPGFYALAVHRLAHKLYNMHVPLIPRLMSEWAHSKTGIDINPGAKIGCPFFIDHGTGVVIGETAVIGNNVKIYQGVTLGALAVRKEDAQVKRHPTIEDNVVIYAGSTILGGNTIVGHDSIIGGNTWITKSIPSHSVVFHKHQTVVNDRKDFEEPINFVI